MKILVLEDNERLLNVIKSTLEKENYQVDTFTDGDDALESLENGKWKTNKIILLYY